MSNNSKHPIVEEEEDDLQSVGGNYGKQFMKLDENRERMENFSFKDNRIVEKFNP